MPLSEAQVQSVLKSLVDPNTGKDFITTRAARNLKLSGDEVSERRAGLLPRTARSAVRGGVGTKVPVTDFSK